jgi:putative oxidoreductase
VLERWQDQVLGLFRIVVGFLFATHGIASMFGILGSNKIEPLVWPGWWAAAIQVVAGALVMVGLGTRYAALLCSGSMAYAYFTVHQSGALLPVQNGGEKPALFCFAFLLVAFFGPGSWALESTPILRKQRELVTAAD